MAGQGKKTFSDGEVLSAADVNGYLMDQSVMRFADSAARTAAIGTPTEGMVTYLDDVNQIEVYDGAAWVDQQAPILSEGTAGQYLQSNGTAGSQWVTLEIAENIITTQGDLIVGAADNTPERLGIGAADTVLTSNGTSISWSAGGAGGATALQAPAAGGTFSRTIDAGVYSISSQGSYPISVDGKNVFETTSVLELDTASSDITFGDATAGVSFNLQESQTTEDIRSVAFGNNTFVAVGANTLVTTSPDGVTWTLRSAPGSTSRINKVVYADNIFAAVGEGGYVITSSDGITWTQATYPNTAGLDDIAYGDVAGLWVIFRFNADFETSPDLVTFTSRNDGMNSPRQVGYGNGYYVAAGFQSSLYYSTDGINWTSVSSGISSSSGQVVSYLNGIYYASFGNGTTQSTDAINWTPNGQLPGLLGMAYNNNKWLFVGVNSTIFDSEDGTNVTPRDLPGLEKNLYGAASNGSNFVVVGETGTAANSVDVTQYLILSEATTEILI